MAGELSEEKLARLRQVASNCTYPGPWESDAHGFVYDADADMVCETFTETAADYVAEANPASVLTLLDERDALRARVAELDSTVFRLSERHMDRVATYEVRLAELEAVVGRVREMADNERRAACYGASDGRVSAMRVLALLPAAKEGA